MLKGVAPYPFLVPLATVPLQSGKHAAKVLEEALDAGFGGAMIGTQPKGATGVLDDPDLDPFWEAASRRKATLFVHPTFGAHDERLQGLRPCQRSRPRHRHHDRHGAAALFRPPRALSGCEARDLPWRRRAADGARPSAPQLCHRAGEEQRPDGGLQEALLRHCRLRCATLRFVCEQAGADKVLMGTDAAVCDRGDGAGGFRRYEAKFGAEERAAILGDTAAKLFDIRG